jgi:hypothetical protein
MAQLFGCVWAVAEVRLLEYEAACEDMKQQLNTRADRYAASYAGRHGAGRQAGCTRGPVCDLLPLGSLEVGWLCAVDAVLWFVYLCSGDSIVLCGQG